MKKIILIVFCFYNYFFSSLTFGQTTTLNPLLNSTMINPPNPETYSFTKYGDLPIGLFTGTFQYSVPIYKMKSGKLTHDLSISYSTNGIKVDEMSGRVGLGWTLNTGGVITRTVMGKPDENNDRMFWPWASNDPSDNNNNPGFWNYINTFRQSSSADLEPDEFFYKTEGMSGKFYKARDNTFKQFRYTGVKIQPIDDQLGFGFMLTQTNGDRYYFTHVENSRNYSQYDEALPNFSNNTWNLKKIISLDGDSIVFNYNENYYSQTNQFITGISQNLNTVLTTNNQVFYMYQGMNGGNITGDACNETLPLLTKLNINEVTTSFLTSIDFSNGKVLFFYSDREDVPNEKKLDSLKIIRVSDNKIIKRFVFNHRYSLSNTNIYDTYISPNNSNVQNGRPYLRKRLFLDTLYEFSNDASGLKTYHSFEYDSIDYLPPRLSFSQDKFGFFNGKENYYFFPKDTWVDILNYGTHIGGDRNFDFLSAKKGILTKIKYPTGGYSNIKYEPNRLNNSGINTLSFSSISAELNPSVSDNQTVETTTFTKDDRPLRMKVTCDWETGPPEFFPDGYYMTYSIINTATNQCEYRCNRPITPGGVINDVDLNYNLGAGNTYKIVLLATHAGLIGKVNLETETLIWNTDPNVNGVAGVRVQSVESYASINSTIPASRKEYVYGSWENPTGASGAGINDITIQDYSFVTVGRKLGSSQNYPSSSGNLSYCGYNIIQSNSAQNLYKTDQSTLVYPKVIELNENNGLNNGGTEYEYIYDPYNTNQIARPLAYGAGAYVWDFSPITITGATFSNSDFLTGMLKKSKQFSYQTKFGPRKIVSETENYYSVDSTVLYKDSFYLVQQALHWPAATQSNWAYFFYFDINKYYRYHSWTKLDSTTTKIYSSINQTLASQTSTSFQYSNNNFKPTQEKNTNSKGEVITKNTYYIADNPNPGIDVLMIGENLIENPSKVVIKKNAQQELSKQQYSYVGNGTNYLPYELKSSILGNVLETELIIERYDSKGNIIQFIGKDGIRTSLIWGYRQEYPVAKIIGSDYNTAIAFINSTIINNLNTSEVDMRAELAKIKIGYQQTNVLVTTYTYKPLIGISSETSPNGRNIYYEYDSFNRLSLIRDHENNIIKKICYNYYGQPETCISNESVTPIWRSTGQVRCQPCTASGNLNYTSNIGEKEEKDINPNSPTYNTFRWVVDPSAYCVATPVFAERPDLAYCEIVNGLYTGNKIIPTYDANPCSATYNQAGNNTVINNAAECVFVTCTPICPKGDPQYKCINGVCVQGEFKVISSVMQTRNSWSCTRAWCFPDGTYNANYTQTTNSSTACFVECN